MDCGPTCLRMIAKSHGKNVSMHKMRQLCQINKSGVSLLDISNAAEKIGFRSLGAILPIDELAEIELPTIVHWRQNHFVVLYRVRNQKYHVADPAKGLLLLEAEEFLHNYRSNRWNNDGLVLLLQTTPEFLEQPDQTERLINWSFLYKYLSGYSKLVFQLGLGLLIGTVFQLMIPFLTQSIVDVGINTRNLNFVTIIIIAQSALIIGRVSVDFIKSWILLHVSARINIAILTDFLIKLMRLPISFFDAKKTGDIMQRMNDQRRIESFLTSSTLNTLFSMVNLIVFSLVLAYFNSAIFFVFAASSLLYIFWIVLFLRRRRSIDYKSFELLSGNQAAMVQLVHGMQDIKLNNCEQQRRWEWEHLQARIFKLKIKGLSVSQYQQGGSTLINESANLLITFLSARAVINNELTLGGMVAMQYIVGQLNGPIQQFLGFTQSFQDARISLERLNDIYEMQDEEPEGMELDHQLPMNKSLTLESLTFKYPGAANSPVLQDLNIHIPEGTTTAIVGASGSGKTTILKLLLRFYELEKGEIKVGDRSIRNISHKVWRKKCGVVMQDGFIFSDTIEKNIALGVDHPDRQKIRNAIHIANISEFIDGLPQGLHTKIGAEGVGISQGQRQRILIARAVYKDPDYLFFDEATNALDANNERIIVRNLQQFFSGRTVVVVAHRLSTVSNADNIILLEKGRIKEEGTHEALVRQNGDYYNLVKNQLELGV
jgi:ATP-binding cassette subfamily B protein